LQQPLCISTNFHTIQSILKPLQPVFKALGEALFPYYSVYFKAFLILDHSSLG